MATNDEVRREARQRYVNDRQALPVIALSLGVSESTLRRWKREARQKGDDWDAARTATTIQGEGLDGIIARLIEDYVIQHQATLDDLKNREGMSAQNKAQVLASLADSMAKVTASAGRLSPKINKLGVAMDVLRLLGEFLPDQFPQHTAALLEVLEPFGERLAEIYRRSINEHVRTACQPVAAPVPGRGRGICSSAAPPDRTFLRYVCA